MTEAKWEVVAETYGELQAEILRGLLEAQGIPVVLSQEGAGRAYGIQVGPLGLVQLLVPSDYVLTAQDILTDYQTGKYATPESDETTNENDGEGDEGQGYA